MRQALLALLAVVGLLLLSSARADALLHRGHEFQTTLETTGENKLSNPSAVASNEQSSGKTAGDSYVLDRGNNRVVRFGSKHEFLEAWGYGVQDGAAQLERCTEAANCKPGLAGFKEGQFNAPNAIAVDSSSSSPSAGDVYVVANRTWNKDVVDKFDGEGKLLGTLLAKKTEKEEVEGAYVGVAVDPKGQVWVEREDEEEEIVLQSFTNAVKNERIGEPEEFETIELPEVASERPARPGFAIDSKGRFYVTYEPEGIDAEEEAEELKEHLIEKLREPCQPHRCLIAQFKLIEKEPGVYEGEALNGEFNPEGTNGTGVAVDQLIGDPAQDDVYTDLASGVRASTASDLLIQEFGSEQLTDGGGFGVAVNGRTNEVLVPDRGAGKVYVYEPAKPHAPTVEQGGAAVAEVTSTTAKISATIDPGGADTHYVLRYGEAACLGNLAGCPGEATAPDLGSAFGDRVAPGQLSGLTPGTTYHVIVIATNEFGSSTSPEEVTLTTPLASAAESALADGREWELVTPPEKHGASVEPIAHEGGLIEASTDGKRLTYVASSAIGEEAPAGQRAPELSQLIGARTSPGEWSMHNLTTPNETAQGINANSRREYQFFSSDLGEALVDPVEQLSAEQVALGEESSGFALYRRSTACSGPHCYQLIVSGGATLLSFQPEQVTPDFAHAIVLDSQQNKLYEWSREEPFPGAGHLTLVSVLPDGQAATSSKVGLAIVEGKHFLGDRGALSDDGSHVVWEQLDEADKGKLHLYDTEISNGVAATVEIDQPNTGVTGGAATNRLPIYMISSKSGDRVFFTDNEQLTEDASPKTEKTGDLYVFERSKPEGERLTDLTPDAVEPAAVQGGVLGAGETGEDVYFVANGALAPGAKPGKCVKEGVRLNSCSLYLSHYNGSAWESPRFIATLSNEDGPDWAPRAQERGQYNAFEMTARVSPDGQRLAFMSDRRLTPYNNTDANSGAPDEEVYLYNAAEGGSLVCASCNPSGAQPIGVHDVPESGEGQGLLVDRPGIWSTEVENHYDNWLAGSIPGWTPLDSNEAFYQSRYLSNEGRLFFNSSDALVKQDVNGKEDVYEYEPAGLGSCASASAGSNGGCIALVSSGRSEQESAFLDASVNGSNAFFLTTGNLLAKDTDKAFDIYDARICSGAGAEEGCPPPSAPPAPPCKGEECRAGVSAQPSFGSPPSATQSGSGNVAAQVLGTKTVKKAKPLTRAQKLAAALKTCHKKYAKQKKKRLACEKLAKRKYGVKKAAKKSSTKHKQAKKSSRTRS